VGLGSRSRIDVSGVVDISDWVLSEETLTGSREKVTLVEPDTNHYYIHKFPKQSREHQLWSELLASYIAGDLLGWEVQHTSIALRKEEPGNLLRYVYAPEKDPDTLEVFTEGWRFCTQVDSDFDVDKGTRHTLPLIIQVCDEVLVPKKGLNRNDFMDFWARGLALDTLISNTDRHAENWAVIEGPDGTLRMAAFYDNGSSLGCGIDQVGLDRAFDASGELKDSHIEKQRRNGRHHLRLDEPGKRGGDFEEVCVAFLSHYPEGRRWFEDAGKVDIDAVRRLMASIPEQISLPEPHRLSDRRSRHIYAMLQIGMERIKNVLHGT